MSLGQLNAAIAKCVAQINDKPFRKLDGSRRSNFESIDRPALLPLPKHRYEFGLWKQARCNIDYHLEVNRHWYSVPHQLVGQTLDVRVSPRSIEVFFKHKRVASHLRSSIRNSFTTEPSHMPEAHRRYAEWTPSRIVSWANKTGPATGALVEKIIELRPHPEHGYRSSLGIIRLAKPYGEDRLEAACKRALAQHIYSYKSVKSILDHKLDAQPLSAAQETKHHQPHENLRGAHYYQ
jgi:transposase